MYHDDDELDRYFKKILILSFFTRKCEFSQNL